jgi:hypothetical protein
MYCIRLKMRLGKEDDESVLGAGTADSGSEVLGSMSELQKNAIKVNYGNDY